GLTQDLAPHREPVNAFAPGLVTDTGTRGHANGSLRRDGHFGIDDVFGPIALAGGDITGKREVRQGGEGDVMRAADAGFEHAAAPHRNAVIAAEVVDAPRRGESAHTAQLHIDDAAGAQRNGRLRVLFGMDAFIETDRRLELALQFRVAPDIVPAERLLDHHQVVGFEFAQPRRVLESIRGIRVYHQTNLGKTPPQARHRRHIVTRLDLDLDALIAGGQFLVHDALEFVIAFLNADGDAASNLLERAADQLPQRQIFLPRLRIPYGGLDGRFGHIVSAYRGQHFPHIAGSGKFLACQRRPDEVAQDVPGGLDRLGGIRRPFAGDAFAPPGHAIGVNFDQENAPVGGAPEARLED